VYELLARPFVFVTGKGGVGKTTVAAALGLAAIHAGRRPLVCELGGAAGPPGLPTVGVDPEQALGEWLTRRIGGPAAALLRRSQAFGYLVAAAPGAAELITIGKLVDLAREGEHQPVIVDGPATGHALALLQAPTTYGGLQYAGPISTDASELAEFLAGAECAAYIGVALPEPMSVTETLELEDRLPAAAGRGLDLIVVNGVHPDRFTDAEAGLLAQTAQHEGAGVLLPVLDEHRRARRQAEQVAELRRGARAPVVTLPFMFAPAEGAELIEALASVVQGSRGAGRHRCAPGPRAQR